jgi:hypothetical protein
MASKTNVFNDPNYSKLLDIFSTTAVPAFVKEAEVAEEQDFSTTPSDQFGDPGKRLYPLNSKSNTWLSREYFKRDKANLPKEAAEAIEARINKAAEFWGLGPAIELKYEEPAKPAHVVEVCAEGRPVFTVPVSSALECKEAVEHLKANRSKMPYEMRMTFARGILTAPSSLHAQLDQADMVFLEKTAGFGVAMPEQVNYAIATRIASIGHTHPFYAEKLAITAHELKSNEELTPSILHKVAFMLDLVDRATDMHRAYDRGLRAPEDDLFCITQKAAEYIETEIIELANGTNLTKTKVLENKSKINEFFKNVIGEIPYSNDEEMIAVIKSLPRNDADLLIKALEEE